MFAERWVIKNKFKYKLILSQQGFKCLLNIKYRYFFNEDTTLLMGEIILDQDCSEFLKKKK